MAKRRCSRSGCRDFAVATLTFAYADSTMAIGPLAHRPDPGSYDLCARHCEHLTAPRGWELIRIPLDDAPPEDDVDDLVALAEAVREAGFGYLDSHQPELVERSREESAEGVVEVKRKGHLTMLIDPTV